MREVIGEQDVPSWERRGHGVRTNLKEFEAKLRLMKTKLKMRLDATSALIDAAATTKAKVGLQQPPGSGAAAAAAAATATGPSGSAAGSARLPSLPRLIVLCERLGLDEFERSVIVLLIGNTVSPLMKEVLKTFEQSIDKYGATDNITVKLIIQVFCHTFKDQVAHRAYFYKNSRLVRDAGNHLRVTPVSYSTWGGGHLDGATHPPSHQRRRNIGSCRLLSTMFMRPPSTSLLMLMM